MHKIKKDFNAVYSKNSNLELIEKSQEAISENDKNQLITLNTERTKDKIDSFTVENATMPKII